MSSPPVADLPPKTLESAKQQYVEVYGAALAHNTYLRILLVLLCLLAGGLVALNFRTQTQAAKRKPLVIRIDDVGRAEAVQYDAMTYRPRTPEMRYFLTRFVVLHFSRLRSTVQRDYADSLFFLEPSLAEAMMAHNQRTRALETFLTTPSADEVDIVVHNVTLSEISRRPYKASVDFEQVHYAPGTRQERTRGTYIAQIDFEFRDQVPASFIKVNPLGLQITYFRVDQAFEEPSS